MNPSTPPPWYRQFWPWFLLGLLLSSMLVSTGFAIIATRSFDGMVVQEDYYEHGKAINTRLAKDERARALGLAATLAIDPVTGDVVLDLTGEARPERLVLALIFPTQDDRDARVVLTHRRDGRYVGQLETRLRHRWYLALTPEDSAEWRLRGEITLPSDAAVALSPGGSEAP